MSLSKKKEDMEEQLPRSKKQSKNKFIKQFNLYVNSWHKGFVSGFERGMSSGYFKGAIENKHIG